MKNTLRFLAAIILSFSAGFNNLQAQEFFSTAEAPRFFTLGARVGANASNRTFPSRIFSSWNVNSWGSGLEVGVVANLNFRDYFSLQPGFFFESRSGNFSYATDYVTNASTVATSYQMGHLRTYNFLVPVMAIVKFNVLEGLKWSIEAGPYAQFNLHSSDGKQITVVYRPAPNSAFTTYTAETNWMDAGVKVGTGLTLKDHYYFGIHYEAGLLNVWKSPEGGKNKAWTFTLGYDF